MKKPSPVPLVGVLLTAGCLLLFSARPSFVEAISDKVYDALLRFVHAPPKSGRIAIVDLDDESLKRMGQWPWPRYLLADLTTRILNAGASVVAFDVVFPEADRTSPLVMRDDLQKHLGIAVTFAGLPQRFEDFDACFAEALRRGKVILGCGMHPCDVMVGEPDPSVDPCYDGSHLILKGPAGINPNAHLLQADGVTVSLPVLRRSAATAFFNATMDEDSIVRSNPLIWALGPRRIYPSLALEAIRMDLGVSQCIVEYDAQGIARLRLRDLVIPCSKAGRLVANYRTLRPNAQSGFLSSFPSYRAADIIEGKIAPGALTHKIVFVGTSAVGLRDVKATPLTDLFSGVEVHATLADNILSADMLRLPNFADGMQAVAIGLTGLFLTIVLSRGRSWASFLAALVLAIGAILGSAALMRYHHLVLTPTWTLLTVAVDYPVLTMLRYWQEERHKRHVRRMFSTMVSHDVLRYLETNPNSFSLTGERTEATMFFSDVASFTELCEHLDPDKVSQLLNRYLTPMTEIIMAHGGYLDKYEGDAIMAVWGVPFRMKDHAVKACLAALKQQEALAAMQRELEAEFGRGISVRMGIHSGIVTAGNMGSRDHFSYTVLGDAVNTAARLEPANKDYATRIIISEDTWRAAQDHVEARLLDRLRVKGKSVAVGIYELIARKGEMDASKTQVVRSYEGALRLYWDRQWDAALERLQGALETDATDGPALRLHRQIEAFRLAPPPPNWQGETVRLAKD